MGVRGLQHFLEKDCSGAFYEVDIANLATTHTTKTGKQPVVVVDTMSCINKIYIDNKLDWICGGQYQDYIKAWGNFIESFVKLGIRLVFVYDGTSQTVKRKEWVRRRYQTMLEKVYPAFDFLKKGVLPPKMDEKFCLPSLQTKHILNMVYNCEVITSVKEADEEIVALANKMDAIGILGQDSDYIIYQTNVPYLSSQHLNLDTLKTMVYDRCQFAEQIGIKIAQLPIFAVLAGNDVICREGLSKFHRWVSYYSGKGRPYFGDIAFGIGQFINNERYPSNKDLILKTVPRKVASGRKASIYPCSHCQTWYLLAS